jgi:hypothetical protein
MEEILTEAGKVMNGVTLSFWAILEMLSTSVD